MATGVREQRNKNCRMDGRSQREEREEKNEKNLVTCLFDQNSIFRGDDGVEAVAGRLRHPSPTSTDDRDDVCENFLYVFKFETSAD